MSERKTQAIELFNEKYNCSQSILLAYRDIFEIDRDFALKLTSGFGGGIAGLGKTCGIINSAVMILGLKFGNTNQLDLDAKAKTREIIKSFMNEFNEKHRQIDCKSILEEDAGKVYQVHSEKCIQVLEEVCDLLDKYLQV